MVNFVHFLENKHIEKHPDQKENVWVEKRQPIKCGPIV